MRKNRFFLYVMFGMALMLGIEVGGLQYVLLKLAAEFGMSQARMGSLVTINFAAAAVSPIAAGPLADRYGKKPIALISSAVYALSGIGCVLASGITMIIAGVAGFGIGYGGIETVCQAALADRYPEDSARKLVVFQGILSGGCVLAPLILLALMTTGDLPWRVHFVIVTSGFLIGFLLMAASRFEKRMPDGRLLRNAKTAELSVVCEGSKGCDEGSSSWRKYATALIAGVLIGTFIYMFEENAVSYFMDAFYTNVLARGEMTAFSLSIFWAAMTSARFACSLLHRRRREIVLIGFLGSGILAFQIAAVHTPGAALILFGISGAFYGPIWPFLLSMATDRYPRNTGTVTSLIAVVSSAGGAASPVLIGRISDTVGQRYAFCLIGIVFLIGLTAYIVLIYLPQRRNRQ